MALEANHQLLPKEVWDTLQSIHSTEQDPDPVVHLKFFTPWARWTWYVTEASAEDPDGHFVPFDSPNAYEVLFFGLVDGQECELGYWRLSEMLEIRGPGGIMIERDEWFRPTPLSKVRSLCYARRCS